MKKIPLILRPSISIALGAILASFTVSNRLSVAYAAILLIFTLIAVYFLCEIRNAFKFLLSFFIVCLSANYQRRTDLDFLPDYCGVIAKVEMVDFSLVGDNVEGIGNPYYSRCIIRQLRFSQKDDEPLNVNIPAMIEGSGRFGKFLYGDILEVRGYLYRPSEALFDEDFDQKDFFLSKGVSLILYPDSAELSGRRKSFSSFICDIRNKLMSRLLSGIQNDGNRRILAAVIFGCRQGIFQSLRRNMLLAGTIHVIAISGIHTAIFAMLILLILSPLPFRLRYLILPFLTFIYILSAGFQPSALRAFIMIALWSWQKAAFYPSNGFSALFYAVALSLFINPYGILDPGFQYSFVITGFLIGGWRKYSHLKNLIQVESRFDPDSLNPPFHVMAISHIICGFLLCVCAFFAGLQVSLFNQNIFNPFSVLVNLLVSPFLWLIFLFSLITVLFPIALFSSILDFICGIFNNLLLLFSGTAFFLTTPPLLPFLVLFCLPFALIVFGKFGKKTNMFFASLCVSFLSYLFFLPQLRDSQIWAIYGAGKPAAIVLIGKNSVSVVDIPSREHAMKISELLSSKGISYVDYIYNTKALKEYSEGIPYFLSNFNCGNLIFLTNPALSNYAKFASSKAGENLVNVKINDSPTVFSPEKRRSSRIKTREGFTEIDLPENTSVIIREFRSGNLQIELLEENAQKKIFLQRRLKMHIVRIM